MSFTATALTEHFGCRIDGLDAREALSSADTAALKRLFDQRHLLYIAGQDLDEAQQVALSSIFGPPVDEGMTGAYVGYVSNRRLDSATPPHCALPWHSDYAWTPHPESQISLYGYQVTGRLSATRFASNIRAASALSAELRTEVEGARNVMMVDLVLYGQVDAAPLQPELIDEGSEPTFPSDDVGYPRTSHPVLRRHSRTGEEMLFVQEYYSVLIEGRSYVEGQDLLRRLFDVLYDPAHVYSHDWQQGDFVVWDNEALQHGRRQLDAASTGERTLRRVVMHPAYEEVLAFAPRVRQLSEQSRDLAASAVTP